MAGCSSPDTAAANAQLCNSISGVQSQLATLRTMLTVGVATVDQVSDQVDRVRNSVNGLAQSGQKVTASAVAELQSAQATFDKAIDAIPGGATVSQAADAYKAALADYNASVQATQSKVGCT